MSDAMENFRGHLQLMDSAPQLLADNERLRHTNDILLTACRAALIFVKEVTVSRCRIELILETAIAEAVKP